MKKGYMNLLMTALITGVCVGCAQPALADEPNYLLDEMIVTATRTPVKEFDTQADVTVVTRKDIEEKHYTDLGMALKEVPGVNFQNYGASGENYTSNRLYINGSSDIVVLVDGMRANVNGISGSVISPSEISNMDTIERIEVLKGSASTLYGADAVGGVINIITRKAAANSSKTSISTIFGSYGQQTYRVMNRGNEDGLYWMISGQKSKMNDFKDGHGNKVINGLDSETYGVQLGKKFDENSELVFNYTKYRSDYERPQNGGLKETIRTYGEKDNDKISLKWHRAFNKNLSNTISVYRNTNILNDNTHDPSNIWHMDLATLGLSDQITYKTDNNTLIAGFDLYQDRVNDYYNASPWGDSIWKNKHMTNRALFLQDDLQFAKHWNITPGIRYTNTTQFGSNTSKSVTVGFNDGNSNVYTSYREFFVAPNQYQLYSSYGSLNLKPSEGHTVELGINQKIGDSCMANFNVFRTSAENMIGFDMATYKYNNIDNEKIYGWSVGLNNTFSEKFATNINYTHLRIPAAAPYLNENRDGYVPKGEVNVGVDYTLNKFNANLNAKGVIDRPGRKVNEDKVPSNLKTFWLCNLALNYKADDNFKGFVKVNNLFDKFYTDQLYDMDPDGGWYSAPGRNFQIGVEYTF